jgi:hypothetical protein
MQGARTGRHLVPHVGTPCKGKEPWSCPGAWVRATPTVSDF